MALPAPQAPRGRGERRHDVGHEGRSDEHRRARDELRDERHLGERHAERRARGARRPHRERAPGGVLVSEDGKELCAATPCDLTFKDEAATREHKLALVNKKGFKATPIIVSVTDTKGSAKLDGWSGGGAGAVVPPTTGGGTTAPKFDGCLDDSDCKGGRHCMHGWCK